MSQYNFSVLDDAEITQTEFAKLLGVSRVTVVTWINGGEPSRFLRRPVHEALLKIKHGVNTGELPGQLAGMPPNAHTVEARLEYIRSVLDMPY